MFIATYERGFLGGYGDRIVGLMSVFVLADIFQKPFKILWTKEDIHKHVDYTPWDALTLQHQSKPMPPYIPTILILSHEPHVFLRKLAHEPMHHIFPVSPDAVTKFILNQEIIRYLYKNPHPTFNRMKEITYETRLINAYQQLYTRILVPTSATHETIRIITGGRRDFVGIQIRGGDIYMNPSESHTVLDAAKLPSILARIRDHLADESAVIFLTSDMGDTAYECAKTIWGKDKDRIVFNSEPVQHMDWKGSEEDIAKNWKVYVDNYVLAMCTLRLYITCASNYGRIAALAAPHTDIWDLETCRSLAKSELFSKH